MVGRAPRQSRAATELMEPDKAPAAAPVPLNAMLARLAETSPTMASLPAGENLSNQAVARALAPARGPAGEAAADRVADVLVSPAAPAGPVAGEALDTGRAPGARGGEPLPAEALNDFGPRLGHDLGAVRVHRDAAASVQADALHSRAFTVGTDIYLGAARPPDGSAAGRRLLAHELAHVVQQRSGLAVQRQAVPPELQSTPNYRTLSDEDLRMRHDWILEVLKQFNESNAETKLLEDQVGAIGVELARRSALAAGRTFAEADINNMKAYFIANATGPNPEACIVTLNKGLKLATAYSGLDTTNYSIEKTMAKIKMEGYTGEPKVVQFLDATDRITGGVRRPEKLNESVWDALMALAAKDPGWSVFTMSLLDGYHSITLTLDANDPAKPKIFWSDQWSTKGGWKEYDRAGLDDEVLKLVRGWWDAEQDPKKKAKTVVRLWRVRATSPTP